MVINPLEIRALFGTRAKVLVENSNSIISQIPITWNAVISNLTKHDNLSTFKLIDVELAAMEDVVIFVLHDCTSNKRLKQKLPIVVIIDAELSQNHQDPNLVRFLNQNPACVFPSDNSSKAENRLEEAMRFTQLQYPTMFIDIPRMIEVEQLCSSGKIFKLPFYDTKH